MTDTYRNQSTPWREKHVLESLYVEDGKTAEECAEELGCSKPTVLNWLRRHDIPVNPPQSASEAHEPICEKSRLKELYHEKRLTQREIADELGCSQPAVNRHLKKYGLEPDDPQGRIVEHNRKEYVRYGVLNGYPVWFERWDNERHTVSVHRLLAVAEYGFDAVADNVVHHKNHLKWDNRPDNLEVMGDSEHKSHHARLQ